MKKIANNDMVYVTTGKDKGKTGKVTKVLDKKVLVSGINIVKKHLKPSATQKRAGIIDINKPIDISNVEVICPHCQKKVRIRFKLQEDKKIRICSKCKEIINYEK